MSNDNISCWIRRSERPCLVCSGHMDLIEAHPNRSNLFSRFQMVCSFEGIDCLDCPKCGFKTTTADYQYLHMCKKEGKVAGIFQTPSNNSKCELRRKQNSGRRREDQHNHHRRGRERTCSFCHASLESSSWQFCPSCGTKCSIANKTKDTKEEESNSNQDVTPDTKFSNSSSSFDNGIVRTVTPPRTSTNDNTDTILWSISYPFLLTKKKILLANVIPRATMLMSGIQVHDKDQHIHYLPGQLCYGS